MKSELIIPNLHVVLVHYPLGLLVVGVLIETFSFLWRRSGFRAAGRWMILLGALSTVPATFSGIYALHDIAFRGGADGAAQPWVQAVASSPLSESAWHQLTRHVWLQGIATGLAVLAVVLWIACSDIWRRKLHFPILLMLLASVGVAGSGAWFAGEAIYRNRVGVDTGTPNGEPPKPLVSSNLPASLPSSAPSVESVEDEAKGLHAWAQYAMPPLQTHITLAGFAVAVACASIALSIRRMVQLSAAERQFGDLAAVLGSPGTVLDPVSPNAMYAATATQGQSQAMRDVVDAAEFTPASRFWVLTFFVALTTSLTGAWYLGIDAGSFVPKELWDLIYNDLPERSRRFAHVIGGSLVVLLPIVLALLARFAPRKKVVFGLFTALLLFAVCWQAWVGILMLYDSVSGPLRAWNGT